MSTTYTVGTGTTSGAVGQTTLACVLSAVAESQAVIRDFVLANANAPVFLEKRTLTSGVFQAFTHAGGTIPEKAGGVIIFPATGTTSLLLKGIAGDTGISLHVYAPVMLAFPTSHASLAFGLLAVGTSLEYTFAWF